MTAKIVFLDRHLTELRELVFNQPGVEGAAFVLCGEVRAGNVIKLLSHAIIPVAEEDYSRREKYGLTITSRALARITKLARYENLSILFAHSHPDGMTEFSAQDDKEEAKLLPFFQSRVPQRIHGTLVLTEESIRGRIYNPNRISIGSILSVGEEIRLWSGAIKVDHSDIFDRQVRAFGKDIQEILQDMHIGIIGLGGTGSPLAEQLYRLGVGEISLFDGDVLEKTNVNRVYGSSISDVGKHKVEIAKSALDRVGLKTKVHSFSEHITYEDTAMGMRDCDVIFGCTDKQIPRAILTQFSLRYNTPVFDLGVLIDSEENRIKGVHGRVTTLMPGEACLFCRGRITPEVMRIEGLSPEDRTSQVRDGYAPELGDPAPAVIAFTSAIASAAVSEFLHRLTGFMGSERLSSEILYSFDENRIRTNRVPSRDGCMCSDTSNWGRGDANPFLEMMWPNRTK